MDPGWTSAPAILWYKPLFSRLKNFLLIWHGFRIGISGCAGEPTDRQVVHIMADLLTEFHELEQAALQAVAAVKTAEEVETLRIRFFGRRGQVPALLRRLGE
jgi:hypothetical protein